MKSRIQFAPRRLAFWWHRLASNLTAFVALPMIAAIVDSVYGFLVGALVSMDVSLPRIVPEKLAMMILFALPAAFMLATTCLLAGWSFRAGVES